MNILKNVCFAASDSRTTIFMGIMLIIAGLAGFALLKIYEKKK